MDKLKELYYSSKTGLTSKAKFKIKVKKLYPEITNKEIDTFLSKQEITQVNKKGTFKGFYKIVAEPNSYQMDIFFFKSYKKTNRNYDAFFIFVDILSRKMFVYPIKNRKTETLINTLKEFVKDAKEVYLLSGDDEFSNKEIVKFCDDHNIRLTTNVSAEDHFSKGDALGIVDRATRTIKTIIRNFILAHGTTKFIDDLQDLVSNYNDTPHRSLNNKTPDEVYKDKEFQRELYESYNKQNKKLANKVDLDIGDYVRKRVDKGRFDKEQANFSKEIYVISKKVGTKYRIIDADEIEQKRDYKYFELIKVNPDEVEGRIKTIEKEIVEKQAKIKRKLRKEFGELIKPQPKKAIVKKSNKKLDRFDSDSE